MFKRQAWLFLIIPSHPIPQMYANRSEQEQVLTLTDNVRWLGAADCRNDISVDDKERR